MSSARPAPPRVLNVDCPPTEAPSGCPPDARPWVLLTAILGSSLAFLDGSVLQIALPRIQTDFQSSLAMMQWVHNGYLLMLSALLLPAGAAGDLFGRRRVFGAGVLLFTLASAWCGFARTAEELVIARTLQGLGGALLVPNSLALVSAHFPAAERGRAIGTWAAFAAVTTAAGPPLGGFLMDVLSWRYVFFLNIPVAALTLAVLLSRVPETGRLQKRKALDAPGALLAAAMLGTLTYALIESSEAGLREPRVLLAFAAAPLLLLAYIRQERRAADPMTPLEVFRCVPFVGANALTLTLYFAMSGVFFLTGFYMIQVHGYSGAEAGLATAPFPILLMALSRWSGRLMDRVGPRTPLMLGSLITAIACVLFARVGLNDSYWVGFLPAFVALGLGMATAVAPLTTTVLNSLSAELSGVASGLNNAVSRVAGLLAVALLGALALALFQGALERGLEASPLGWEDLPPGVLEQMAAAQYPAQISAERKQELQSLVNAAFASSYASVMLVCAAAALAAAACAWFWIRPDREDSAAGASDLKGAASPGGD